MATAFSIFVILLMAAMPIAFIGLIVYLVMRARKGTGDRTKQLQLVANQLGWSLVPKAPYTTIPYANSFNLFTQGTMQRVYNVLSGQRNGAQVMIFDYTFVRNYQRGLRFQTVALVLSNQINLPSFTLRPGGHLKDKLGLTLGHIISFPSHSGFSSQYVLEGKDEQAIRSMFGDSLLSYCEAHPGLSMQGGGGLLFVFREQVAVPPQNISLTIDESLHLFASLASLPAAVPPPLPPPPLPAAMATI
jgi:hypothetical protein